MANKHQIPISLASFLLTAGMSEKTIKSSDLNTRLFHDLGLYGDIAIWFMEDLEKQVDMSRFYFERYFPPEFYGQGIWTRLFFGFCPFVSLVRRKREFYVPVTLRMVMKSLEKGEWIEPYENGA